MQQEPSNIVEGVTFSIVGLKVPYYQNPFREPGGRAGRENRLTLTEMFKRRAEAYKARHPEGKAPLYDGALHHSYILRDIYPLYEIDPENVLRDVTIADRFKTLPSVLPGPDGPLVNARIKAAAERLEKIAPIQFVPVQVRTENGKLQAEYYFMNILMIDDVRAHRLSGFKGEEKQRQDGSSFMDWDTCPERYEIRRQGERIDYDYFERFVDYRKAKGRHVILTDGYDGHWEKRKPYSNDLPVLFSRDVVEEAGLKDDPTIHCFDFRVVEEDLAVEAKLERASGSEGEPPSKAWWSIFRR